MIGASILCLWNPAQILEPGGIVGEIERETSGHGCPDKGRSSSRIALIPNEKGKMGVSSSWRKMCISCISGPKMKNAPTVFAQIMAGLDATELSRSTARCPMPRASRSLRVYDHLAAMVFAQLTYRESLRGIETCLSARPSLTYHMGIRGRVTRTNLAYANEHRDWRIFSDVAPVLMRRAWSMWTGWRTFVGRA